MGLQATHPGQRASRGTRGDAGEGPQPGFGAVLAVGLVTVPGAERGQHRRTRGGQPSLGTLQAGQDLSLGVGRQFHRLAGGQEGQPGLGHGQRIGRV